MTDSEASVQPSIAVIIPYFQREAGLLSRALRSVFDQVDVKVSTIIVVDDGSPAPAQSEIAAFSDSERSRVILIEQPNAGVSSARNRGLDALPDSIELIAFLDSDDRWVPQHLARALIIMLNGGDLYFADHQREGVELTRFSECGLNPDPKNKLSEASDIYWFKDDLFSSILRRSPVGTSTVVFRRKIGQDIRFRDGLSVGEDNLFWMELVKRGAQAGFGIMLDTEYGVGVNIFAGATWGNPKVLPMLLDTMIFHRLAGELFSLSPGLAEWNASWHRQVRRDFALNLLHLLRHRRQIDWQSVRRFITEDPMVLFDFGLAPFGFKNQTMNMTPP
jgi:succinoglycan biosynthesis protein ExoW